MNIIFNFSYFSLGALLSYIILKNGINVFHKYFLDNPNKRSLHKKPVPRAGGLAFIIPLFIYDLIFSYFKNFQENIPLSFLCIPLIFISFLDDLIQVSPKYRYLFQLSTSLLILRFGNIDLFFTSPILNFLILIVLVIFITAAINFTNFMDGSDGLVAGCMFIFFFYDKYKVRFKHVGPYPAGLFSNLYLLELVACKNIYGGCREYFFRRIFCGKFTAV